MVAASAFERIVLPVFSATPHLDVEKDKVKKMPEHGIDVLNFQLNMLMYLAPLGILAITLVTISIIILLGMFSTVVILVNTTKVINEQPCRYPLIVETLKRQ